MENANHQTDGIRTPPKGFFTSLRFMGPGLILSAAIVGSGELIATTTLGAKTGFTLMWIVLLGCVVKVAVQLEYGRYCIQHGLPSFQAWNQVGKVKWWGIHWSLYIGFFYMLANMAGQAGVLGGAAQVVTHIIPAIPIALSTFILVFILALLVFHGKYQPVEIIATALNFIFIIAVFYCVYQIQYTPYAFTSSDLLKGFSFNLPSEYIVLALGAFGITGVASGEITMYPYWCMEKGYAAWTGPKENTPEWQARARGWIRVMTIDAVISMFVYTAATIAFYILGAAVLSTEENFQDGAQFIFQLSSMFTNVLGENTRAIFMLCAFTVLFSTIFANTAAFSRLWTDFFGICGWLNWKNILQRTRSISIVAWAFPILCGIIYLVNPNPLELVIFMGVCNSLYLVVVAYQAIIFRYRHTDPSLQPSKWYDGALWISILSIAYMAGWVIYSTISKID